MHPTLVNIGRFAIHSYGLMLAISFLVGIYMAAYRARRFGVAPHHVLDLSVYLILAAVVGSRLLYVAFHLEDYRNPLDIFALWPGGATLYGGFLLAVFSAYVFIRRRGLSFLLMADIVAPSIALGIMFTRIGCFLSGCCFGKPTDLPWGVVFPPTCPAGDYASSLGPSGSPVPLHPTQLYSSLYGLVIFVLILAAEKKLPWRGSTFGLLLVLYGIARFTVDFFRYYESNMLLFDFLTLNQVLSLGLVVVGLWMILRRGEPRL